MYPSEDTTLQDDDHTINRGSSTNIQAIWAGNSKARRALMKFSLSGIGSNWNISNVTLFMSRAGTDTCTQDQIGIYRMTRDFTSSANWLTYNGTNSWTTSGGDFNSTYYSVFTPNSGCTNLNVDITTLFNEWVAGTYNNYGLLLKPTATSGTNIGIDVYSTEYSVDVDRPKVVITYTTPTPTPTGVPPTPTSTPATSSAMSQDDRDYTNFIFQGSMLMLLAFTAGYNMLSR